jgi:hypothetical protein
MTKPFNIESADIKLLNAIQLTQLLKELLHAEAFYYNLPQRAIEVALNITTGDGGEDGRISWKDGPESTPYIPNRLTSFQNKATDMTPSAYRKEILTTGGDIKPLVEQVLDSRGSYIVFTTQELNSRQKQARIGKIREALSECGKSYASTCDLHIYDASQIAGWASLYIPSIVAIQYWVKRPVSRGLKTFDLWSEHENLSRLPFAQVESRKKLIEELGTGLLEPKSCFRIMGLSGLGKTRTAFQIFADNEEIRNLMIYVDANHVPDIDALVADWVSLGFKAVLVVDNCEYRLHERLTKEVIRTTSKISLLSLDYNFDSISPPTISFKLEQMSDEELLQLLNPVYNDQLPDLYRIVNFAQGFPQMAVLLAEARLSEDPKIGELTDDELANKLLWRHGESENSTYLKILRACSLFDVFGVEKEVENQLEYIANLTCFDIDTVYECVQQYSDRGLIDRRGRFGQVVPKPLAMRLAGQWWTTSRKQKQEQLVDKLPENMVTGFCDQVEKMDFHTDVKLLTEKLCGPQGPFGQAEMILSSRGSRLFRAFVNVNPDVTSAALYNVLNKFDHHQLLNIKDDARRNLVWALEKLCFHSHLFKESAWCMLLLASSENENFSNNATGMFAQLFRVNLSGTAAEPSIRFAVLQRAFDLNQETIDMIVLKALKETIRTFGASRAVGAEYQGSKAPLEEWHPKIWQDVFDFWQTAFDFLLMILERGDNQKEKVMSEIGHAIRGFVSRGRIDMLDTVIKKIIKINGKYWPAALGSIKHSFEYDSEKLNSKAIGALNSWLTMLDPCDSDLPTKLKIIVLNPPWEHHKGSDEHYVDIAAEKAKTLAKDVAKDIQSLFPYLNLLTQGEQRQSYTFGRQLAIELTDCTELLKRILEQVKDEQSTSLKFALGIYDGINEKSQIMWQENIDNFLEDEQLIIFYPDFIRTGKIQKPHLDILLKLIRTNVISANSLNALSYGSVTSNIDPITIAEFCLELSSLGDKASWVALNIIFMYCFGNKKCTEQIHDSLKELVLAVPLHEDQKETYKDIYHWHEIAQDILKTTDQDFAVNLLNQLIDSCRQGFDYSDIWDYIKPLLANLMKKHGETLWPILGEAITKAEGMELYWLQQLLSKNDKFSDQSLSSLSVLPADYIISWCKKNPDIGPNFVSNCIDILETVDNEKQPTKLFIKLLENFGNDEKVVNALSANMFTRSWSGSFVPYLEADRKALLPLMEHGNKNVRKWIKEHISYINKKITDESTRDAEHDLGIY